MLFEESQVDPGLEGVAQTDETSVQNNVFASVRGGRTFRLPDGDSGAEHADSPSEDEAADDELCEREAAALEDFANQCENASHEGGLAPAKDISDPGAAQSAEERTNGEGGDDCTLDGGLLRLLGTFRVDGIDLREGVVPVAQREKTADTGLVVPKQDECGEDDEEELRHAQGVARKTHREESGLLLMQR